MRIHHIALATGEKVIHRLDLIPVEAVKLLRQILLPEGGQVPNYPAYHVEICGRYFVLLRGTELLLTCGIGHGDDDEAVKVWTELARFQRCYRPVVAQRPSSGWWMITVILPGLRNVADHEYGWITDFQCCLAAALLFDPETEAYPG